MFFASDNAGPAHPSVLETLVKANEGYAMGYGNDAIMDRVREKIRGVFEAPNAAVYLVATGTTANSLLLATMANPWDTIFCSEVAHIQTDECNAPEFYSGAKLTPVETENAKIIPDALRKAIDDSEQLGVHSAQRGPISITQVTERGTIYSLGEIATLTGIAKEYGIQSHLDGARFTNAMVALGCTAAEMTWKAGIDAVSFGGTKNGLIGVEACVIFDPDTAWEFELRRKRGGHLFSKHRFLSAQMEAYLTDDLWIDMARAANARCAELLAGLRDSNKVTLPFEPQANMIYFKTTRREHARMLSSGATYYVEDGDHTTGDPDVVLTGRLVTDWSTTPEAVDGFLTLLRG